MFLRFSSPSITTVLFFLTAVVAPLGASYSETQPLLFDAVSRGEICHCAVIEKATTVVLNPQSSAAPKVVRSEVKRLKHRAKKSSSSKRSRILQRVATLQSYFKKCIPVCVTLVASGYFTQESDQGQNGSHDDASATPTPTPIAIDTTTQQPEITPTPNTSPTIKNTPSVVATPTPNEATKTPTIPAPTPPAAPTATPTATVTNTPTRTPTPKPPTSTPTATPTPTPTPGTKECFTVNGDTTGCFLILPGLTGNISRGSAYFTGNNCSACHAESTRRNRTYLQIQSAFSNSAMSALTKPTNQQLADLTAYLNRFNR